MAKTPKHIAIIMDGNGRWATQRKLPRFAGHRSGAKVVKKIVEYCGERGIEALTLFAFSLENRARPVSEVRFLMKLMLEHLQKNTTQLHENNVRLRIIGERKLLDQALQQQIQNAEELTYHNTGLNLSIAINYTGRWDIAQAAQKLLQSKESFSSSSVSDIESYLQQHLSLSEFHVLLIS